MENGTSEIHVERRNCHGWTSLLPKDRSVSDQCRIPIWTCFWIFSCFAKSPVIGNHFLAIIWQPEFVLIAVTAGFRGMWRMRKKARNYVACAGPMFLLASSFALSNSELCVSSLSVVVLSSISSFCQNLFPRVISPAFILDYSYSVLCLEWDTHYWTKEDLIKCADWGNYTAQRSARCRVIWGVDIGRPAISAGTLIERSFGGLHLMDSGVPGWQGNFCW